MIPFLPAFPNCVNGKNRPVGGKIGSPPVCRLIHLILLVHHNTLALWWLGSWKLNLTSVWCPHWGSIHLLQEPKLSRWQGVCASRKRCVKSQITARSFVSKWGMEQRDLRTKCICQVSRLKKPVLGLRICLLHGLNTSITSLLSSPP